MIIDASNLILGRMASVASKKALLGEEIIVINCENAIITGKKKEIIGRYMKRFELGQPQQGPFFPRRSDQFVRRVIRGMLPWKRSKGREAYKKVKCFISIPPGIDSGKVETIQAANIERASMPYFMTVKEICRLIGK